MNSSLSIPSWRFLNSSATLLHTLPRNNKSTRTFYLQGIQAIRLHSSTSAAEVRATNSHPTGGGAASQATKASEQSKRTMSIFADPNQRDLRSYQRRKATAVSLQQMRAMTSPKALLKTCDSLAEELRIRFAHHLRDFERLPTDLSNTDAVQHVRKQYQSFFDELCKQRRVVTDEEHIEFCQRIESINKRDSRTLFAMALGIQEWRRSTDESHCPSRLGEDPSLVAADVARRLDHIFTARLSVRLLIGQHVDAMKGGSRIRKHIRIMDVARDAAAAAEAMCKREFGMAPRVDFIEAWGSEVRMTYVKSHLQHILFELLKNSMRAVVEQHAGEEGVKCRRQLTLPRSHTPVVEGQEGQVVLPTVRVVVSGGDEDVVIKVSDLGGGVPRSEMSNIWSYQYTTADAKKRDAMLSQHAELERELEMRYQTFHENFYGLGYGLPTARAFARYFGGDLSLYCTEGWGTDAYVHLKRLESTAVEGIRVLPD